MQEVHVINSHVPGSSAAHIDMHNQIHATITQLGMPTFFITINSANVSRVLVPNSLKLLAGSDISYYQSKYLTIVNKHSWSLKIQ